MTLTHALGGFQSWEMVASADVLAMENLQNSAPSGAEAIQYPDCRHDAGALIWASIRSVYAAMPARRIVA